MRSSALVPGRTVSRSHPARTRTRGSFRFRGAYLRLRAQRSDLVRGLIYPVPDPRLPFLGVHLTRTVSGDVLVGPTALLVGARDAYRLRGCGPGI